MDAVEVFKIGFIGGIALIKGSGFLGEWFQTGEMACVTYSLLPINWHPGWPEPIVYWPVLILLSLNNSY